MQSHRRRPVRTHARGQHRMMRLLARIHADTQRIAILEQQLTNRHLLPQTILSGRLNAILAICAALLVTQEIEAILRIVVREANTLFPGASGALLYLIDDKDEHLILRATNVGKPMPLIIRPGQGLSGRAFLAPRAMLVVGPEVESALEELDAEQIDALQQMIHPWPPTSALLAPLRIEGQRLGALVMYGSASAHLFLPRDLQFIQSISDLAAVAISARSQVARTAALQRDLDQTQTLHAEAQARLNAAQAQLLQSAKLAAVGELAASVAHEINNPLYAARNSLYLVEQDLPADAPQRPFLTIAQSELGRIARIITRMREFYRPARDELDTTPINELLEETIELVQTHLRHGQVGVQSAFDPAVGSIVAHADQLRQVFLNLMLNACDAMPDGGELQIRTEITAATEQHSNGLNVFVSDTGTGIDPEHLPHLFEPFYTTKPQGTGLGLAISAHIITQHGGFITVESSLGKGTTFRIFLPAT